VIICADAIDGLKQIKDCSINTCVTSPPYYNLRDYGVDGQIGLEKTVCEYIKKLVSVFRDVHRVLREDGTLWMNMGDTYAACGLRTIPSGVRNKAVAGTRRVTPPGYKAKDIIGIPWMLAFALREDGWFLRQDIIWRKPNAMPESVTDRCSREHEYIFLLSKSKHYYFDALAIKERSLTKPRKNETQGTGSRVEMKMRGHGSCFGTKEYRNRRSVWTVSTKPFFGAHFATFPPELIRPCVLAGAPPYGVVLDPFFGSGTVGVVAIEERRKYVGVEINPEYVSIAKRRIASMTYQHEMFYLSERRAKKESRHQALKMLT